MTIREVIAQLESGGLIDDSREPTLRKVIMVLSAVSKSSLVTFEAAWDYNLPFEEFAKVQNQVFLKCLRMELSELGERLRRLVGLVPLTEDTEV